MWAPDRLHLSCRGHALVASAVLQTLGVPTSAGTEHLAEVAAAARRSWLAARRSNAVWFRNYFAPWAGRGLRVVARSATASAPQTQEELTSLVENRQDTSSGWESFAVTRGSLASGGVEGVRHGG